MFKKKCRCGKTEKNFKLDIGPFFISECCEEAGYDHAGRKPSKKPTEKAKTSEEKPKVEETFKVREESEKFSKKKFKKKFKKSSE